MIRLPAGHRYCLFALLCYLPVGAVVAQDNDKSKDDGKPKIEGAWRMVGQLTDSGEIRETQLNAMKFIMGGQWCVTASDPNSSEVVYHHGGTYTFDGKKYTENIKYVAPAPLLSAGNQGKTFQFSIEFKGNRLVQKGIGNPYNEVWERVQAVQAEAE